MKNYLISLALLCFVTTAAFATKPGKLAQTVYDYYAAVDAGDLDKVASYLAEGAKITIPFSPNSMDKMSFKQLGMGMGTAFPNMHHKVLDVTEGKNSAAYKAVFSGTNTGSMMGNPPTGNRVELPFIGYMKFDKTGKITELDIQLDVASFNAQLMKGLPDPKMAAENNIRELFHLMDAGQTDQFPMYCSTDFKISNPFLSEPSPIQTFQGVMQSQKAAFPDMRHEIVEIISDGKNVVTKGIFSGTNTGSMMGNQPTGNRVELPFLVLDQLDANGKIISRDVLFDSKSFEAQLMKGANPKEMNKQAALKIMETLDNRDLEGVLASYAPGAKFNGWSPQQLDANGYKAVMSGLLAAFPDSHFIVEDVVAEGDKVIVRHHFKGTHTGADFQGVKPAGKKVSATATVTFQMKDGKPVELWLNADFLGLLVQIGAVQMPQS